MGGLAARRRPRRYPLRFAFYWAVESTHGRIGPRNVSPGITELPNREQPATERRPPSQLGPDQGAAAIAAGAGAGGVSVIGPRPVCRDRTYRRCRGGSGGPCDPEPIARCDSRAVLTNAASEE